MAELAVHNLEKSFGKRKVVKGVSFSVKSGEIVSILGPNGAGKTTCFYMTMGTISPDKGKITIDDKDITTLPIYKKSKLGISYLPQESSIFRSMSVKDNILTALETQKLSRKARLRRLSELLKEFSIEHIKNSLGMSLSGGERRRVEIARLLAINPQFVLLDEPFAGVDPIAVNDIKDLIFNLKDRGIGVLITDHNARETLKISDRGYIVYDGTILVSGTNKEILSSEESRKVYFGEDFEL